MKSLVPTWGPSFSYPIIFFSSSDEISIIFSQIFTQVNRASIGYW